MTKSELPKPILTYRDERLRRRADIVAGIDTDVRRDMATLAATLDVFRKEHGFGRAIAAPQIGIPRRMIAMNLGSGPFFLLNPEIIWRSSETMEIWDDCFSFPDQIVRVRRSRSVSVRYQDGQFRSRLWAQAKPEFAELLQHEIDHLDGILMTDRAVGSNALRPLAQRAALIDDKRASCRISLEKISESVKEIDPIFLNSPQFLVEPLSELLNCQLTVKVETLNPIRSFKGRGADFFVSRYVDRDAGDPLVCASAGNFGQALAYACRKRRLALKVFSPLRANSLKVDRMRALGADVELVGDDLDHAKFAAREYASDHGQHMVEDGKDIEITEGAGTVAIELLAGDAAFDAVIVPLGNGALTNGMARWFKSASPATRVIGVVSAGAPAMAHAWHRANGNLEEEQRSTVSTIADGIAIRVPIAEAVDDMLDLVDDVVEVEDVMLLDALRRIHSCCGLVIEPAGVAGVAAALMLREQYLGQSVATVLTGGNITDTQLRQWLTSP